MTAARSLARLSEPDTQTLDKYWRAANYLAACQIYLMDNPLLADPLQPDQIKPRLLGHWGTTPGLNFVWAHLNRAIRAHDQEMMIVVGPGHGGPAALANTWLEGSYSEFYPSVPRDLAGMRQLFRRGKAGHRPRRPECGERGKRPGLDPQRLRCPLSAADPVG